MRKLSTSRSKKTGLPAGTAVYIGRKKTPAAKLYLFSYDSQTIAEQEINDLSILPAISKQTGVRWLNLDGVDHVDTVKAIGEAFDLHPLAVEDIVNTAQRTKRVVYDKYVYLVLKMLSLDKKNNVISEQVSFVLGDGFVLSFQEEPSGDVFGQIREELRKGHGQVRSKGADFLLYMLLDVIVDHYFMVLESVGERLEKLEEIVMSERPETALRDIYAVKRELLYIRRAIWPLREVASSLTRGEIAFIDHNARVYLGDLYDHVVEVIEMLEMFRDMASGLVEIYLSSTNNRINSVMKALAMVATIFMPLTFISSIYGMNFKYMPELEWHYGYPMVLAVMAVLTIGMIKLFKNKDWL